ncbi:putative membrane lipoprotein [Vibrio phage 275E43-1]|nr:putative membrane lipoprotein [Vibrio phage 275E43-1]
MPSGKIVLKDGLGHHTVSGGCLACYGRYENQTEEAFAVLQSELKKGLPKEKHPSRDWRATVSEHVDHVTIKVPSITNDLTILSEGSGENAMMDVVFAALANDSIWADAFLTKSWADREMEEDEVLMNPHVKAELMISAMSLLRRTCQHWYKLQYSYMVEHGLNYESSLFYAIIVSSGSTEDWSGDEQVFPFSWLQKEQLAAFLEGDYAPKNLEDDMTYAERLGYRQVILEQWQAGTHADGTKFVEGGASWAANLGMNPFRSMPLVLSEEGKRLGGDGTLYANVMSGAVKAKHNFDMSDFSKILGVAGKTVEGKLEEGKFGSHLFYDIKSAVDVTAGITHLKEKVLNNG